MNYPQVSIVIVHFNGTALIKKCLSAVYALSYPAEKREVILVDNGSSDDSLAVVRKLFKEVIIIENGGNNYARANNKGIQRARGTFVALLNNDAVVHTAWLNELVKEISADTHSAAAGSKIVLQDGTLQSAGHEEYPYCYWGDKGFLEDPTKYDRVCTVPSVSNCAVLYRKKYLLEAGLFDENFVMYMEDVDLCHRLRAMGKNIIFVPTSIVRHQLHATASDPCKRLFWAERNRLLFMAKYYPEKLPDVFFGHGDLSAFDESTYMSIVTDVFLCLIKHHKKSRVLEVLPALKETFSKATAYHEVTARHIRKQLDEQVAVLENERIHFRTASQTYEDKLSDLNQNRIRLEADIEALRKESMLHEQMLTEKDQEIHRLMKGYELTAKHADDTREHVQLMHKEMREKEQALGQAIAEMRALHTEISSLTQRLQTCESELLALQHEREKITRDYALLEQACNNYERIANEHVKRTEQSAGKIQELQGMLAAAEERARESDQRCHAYKQKQEELEHALTVHEKKLLQNAELLRKNQADVERYACDSAAQEKVIRQLTEERNKLYADVAALERSKTACEETLMHVREDRDAIYRSESYRFFVRPILWPAQRIIKAVVSMPYKGIKKLCTPQLKKYLPGTHIAQFSSASVFALYGKENHYAAKIVNNSFKNQIVKCVFDIWPQQDRIHPMRHYGYFAVEISTHPFTAHQLTIVYDWEQQCVIALDGKPLSIVDSWRGSLDTKSYYEVVLQLITNDSSLKEQLSVIQKLRV